MKIVLKLMLVVSGLVLVGCGGGGGSAPSGNNGGNNPSSIATQAYQNKKLPAIKKDAIPEVLLGNSASTSKKIMKYSKEIGEISSGFSTLKEKAKFFYKKQLEMNIELGYMDSIWSQVESYCKEKNICDIQSGKIVFTYTEALYKRDIILINEYEDKTGDINTYSEYEDGLKRVIGEKLELVSAKLIVDENAEYKYVLSTEQLGDQEENPNIERSVVKWNDDNKNYFVREEIKDYEGDVSYNQFIYTEIDEEVTSKFTSNNQGFYDESLEFVEKDGKIYFVQDEPDDDDLISFYAEGYLDDNGGSMTVVGAGETYYEQFDEEGTLLSTVSCMDQVKDINNIPEGAFCSITDPDIIKNYITKNIYTLDSAIFEDDASFTPTSNPSSKNVVKFEDNNTLFAIVDCSTFTADYNITNKGIKFSNIVRKISPELQCLYPANEEKFETFLKDGYNQAYSTAYDFWPLFDNAGSGTDFNKTKFMEQLHSETFVDSPLMNSVYKIQSVQQYRHPDTGKEYLLSSHPKIKVEKKKIIVDLVDATFDADIEVLDPTHIQFVNINRVNKDNVTYPDDINLTCVEENIGTPNECLEDPHIDNTNSDKVFADIIERFLNKTIEVDLYTTEYEDISFSGNELGFTGTTRIP